MSLKRASTTLNLRFAASIRLIQLPNKITLRCREINDATAKRIYHRSVTSAQLHGVTNIWSDEIRLANQEIGSLLGELSQSAVDDKQQVFALDMNITNDKVISSDFTNEIESTENHRTLSTNSFDEGIDQINKEIEGFYGDVDNSDMVPLDRSFNTVDANDSLEKEDALPAMSTARVDFPVSPMVVISSQVAHPKAEESDLLSSAPCRQKMIVLTFRDSVAVLTLNNPAKRNILSMETMLEIIETVNYVGSRRDIDGLIIAASGDVFSAGHDFSDMIDSDVIFTTLLFETCRQMMQAIQTIPQPVIAKVQGIATAAGCQLVATCDLAIAADSATFALPGGKGGLFCHTPLVAVSRNIPRKRALEMAMTGDSISASTAAEWGLINKAVPSAQLDDAVLELMARVTRGSSQSKALGKQTFYKQIEMVQGNAYDYSSLVMSNAAVSHDAQEAIAKFLTKRDSKLPHR